MLGSVNSAPLATALLQCVHALQAVSSESCGSISSQFAAVYEAMRPALDKVFHAHQWRGALACGLYLVRSPIALYMWDAVMCPSTAVARPGCNRTGPWPFPGLQMAEADCDAVAKAVGKPPLRIASVNQATGFGIHDFHPFGLYVAGHMGTSEAGYPKLGSQNCVPIDLKKVPIGPPFFEQRLDLRLA